jgi:hypothetical protein
LFLLTLLFFVNFSPTNPPTSEHKTHSVLVLHDLPIF